MGYVLQGTYPRGPGWWPFRRVAGRYLKLNLPPAPLDPSPGSAAAAGLSGP